MRTSWSDVPRLGASAGFGYDVPRAVASILPSWPTNLSDGRPRNKEEAYRLLSYPEHNELSSSGRGPGLPCILPKQVTMDNGAAKDNGSRLDHCLMRGNWEIVAVGTDSGDGMDY
jgi:hypothetical protein